MPGGTYLDKSAKTGQSPCYFYLVDGSMSKLGAKQIWRKTTQVALFRPQRGHVTSNQLTKNMSEIG
jgi:hypothetical protein